METSFHLQKLGRALQEARRNRGLTQAQAAEMAGLTRLSVVHIESGRGTVAIRSYDRLASALGHELSLAIRMRPTLEELENIR